MKVGTVGLRRVGLLCQKSGVAARRVATQGFVPAPTHPIMRCCKSVLPDIHVLQVSVLRGEGEVQGILMWRLLDIWDSDGMVMVASWKDWGKVGEGSVNKLESKLFLLLCTTRLITPLP
jgi:hypothetical protein